MVDFALVPAHNEAENIEELILKLKKHKDIKLVVVDDGSTDGTPEIVKKLGVTLLTQKVRRGKGQALKDGFLYILKKHPNVKNVILIDADMQYLPEDVQKILEPLKKEEVDLVAGYRDFSDIPIRHMLGNFVWKTFFNILFGTNFKDTNCGFMAMTKETMKKMVDVMYGGYIIENAMYIQAVKNKMRVKQIPVTVNYNEKSKVIRGIRVVAGVLIFILKEGFKYRLGIKD
jgi:dolichol-phosphate mannosyltransferase